MHAPTDCDKRIPKYRQFRQLLEEQIRSGHYGPGARVPSEAELAATYGLSRQTVRQAQELLEADGWLSREQGRGTFVCYPPRPAGAAARAVAVRDVGVLIPCITITLYPGVVRGVEDALRDQGYHMVMGSYDVDPDKEAAYLQDMLTKPVAGVVACPSYNSRAADYQRLLAHKVALVEVDTALDGLAVDAVSTDDFWSAHEGAVALLAAGCRQIGFLVGRFAASTSRERLAGCRTAVEQAGLSLRPELMQEGAFSAEFGYAATCRLLAEHPELDGLFVANDPITVGVVRALREHGRWLPICTFDEPDVPSDWQERMIMLKQARYALGHAAGETVLDRIREKQQGRPAAPPRRIRIQAEIALPAQLTAPGRPAGKSRHV